MRDVENGLFLANDFTATAGRWTVVAMLTMIGEAIRSSRYIMERERQRRERQEETNPSFQASSSQEERCARARWCQWVDLMGCGRGLPGAEAELYRRCPRQGAANEPPTYTQYTTLRDFPAWPVRPAKPPHPAAR
nr:hypothetical protein CFP56_66137 [Quercus suber]